MHADTVTAEDVLDEWNGPEAVGDYLDVRTTTGVEVDHRARILDPSPLARFADFSFASTSASDRPDVRFRNPAKSAADGIRARCASASSKFRSGAWIVRSV